MAGKKLINDFEQMVGIMNNTRRGRNVGIIDSESLNHDHFLILQDFPMICVSVILTQSQSPQRGFVPTHAFSVHLHAAAAVSFKH